MDISSVGSALGIGSSGNSLSALSSAAQVPGPETAAPVAASGSTNASALKQMFNGGSGIDLQA